MTCLNGRGFKEGFVLAVQDILDNIHEPLDVSTFEPTKEAPNDKPNDDLSNALAQLNIKGNPQDKLAYLAGNEADKESLWMEQDKSKDEYLEDSSTEDPKKKIKPRVHFRPVQATSNSTTYQSGPKFNQG